MMEVTNHKSHAFILVLVTQAASRNLSLSHIQCFSIDHYTKLYFVSLGLANAK